MNDEEKIIVMVFVLTMASNPFVGLAPFYVAMDKGFFKDCGLDFSMVDFDDSSASCSALLAGKVDLAYTTLDAAIIAESQYDEDMMDVTAIVDESAGADGILVKNDINSIADLKGKTVGVSINQTSHYLLMQALETAGLTDADVTWEPYLSNAVEQGVGKLIFSSKDAPVSILIKELLRSQWNRHNYWQKNNSRIRLLLTDIVV